MRNAILSSAYVDVPPRQWSTPYAIPSPQCEISEPIRGRMMPATKADIAELRGILRHLRTKNPNDPVVTRSALDTLERALSYLDQTIEPNSPLWWAAGALRSAYRKMPEGIYIVTNRDTATWALDQIFELLPEHDEHGGDGH